MNPSQATRRGALLLPVMLSFLLSASLPAAPRQELSAPADIQGVPCRGPVRFHDNGRLAACTLARAAEVGGFLLPAGTEVFFTPGGEWSELVLGAEATVFHLALPAGSRVFAASRFGYPSIWPARALVIQGQLCSARDDGIGHYLYPSGRLQGIWLTHATEIDGVPCTSSANPLIMPARSLFGGTTRMAWFHENGRLEQAMLARDCVIQGHAFRRGDLVSFDAEGKLEFPAHRLGDETRGPVAPPWWPRAKNTNRP